jgi:hypothetical protein
MIRTRAIGACCPIRPFGWRTIEGWLLFVAGAGYLVDLGVHVLVPSYSGLVATVITYPAGAIGELTFLVWLLVRGVRRPASTAGPAQLSTVDVAVRGSRTI